MKRKSSRDFLHRTTGEEVEIYECDLGTTPEAVRDQEERVHERAADLAQRSSDSNESDDPEISGETVRVLSHDSEDRDQDYIHHRAAKSVFRRRRL